MAKPTNLLKTDFGYCFRMIVPEDLRDTVGQREIRYSLKERASGPAKRKAARCARILKDLFQSLRSEMKKHEPAKLDPKEINRALKVRLQRTIEGIADARAVRPFRSPEAVGRYLEVLGLRIKVFQTKLATGDLSVIEPDEVDSLAAEMGIDTPLPGSDDYKRLATWLLRLRIKEMQTVEEMTAGDFDYSILAAVEAEKVKEKQSNGITLGELTAEFWEEKSETWKPATSKEYKRFNEVLLEYFGPTTRISELDFDDGRKYLKHLKGQDTPGHVGLKTPKGTAMSATRRNDYIGYAASVWTFATRRHHVTDNIMDGLKTARKKRADKQRDAFTKADIKTLFVDSPEFRLEGRNAIKRADHFFITLLAAYQGMRIEEIASLYVEDIIKEKGLDCISINENHPDKSLKTASSERVIPIHDKLIAIGFLDYVKAVKAQGHARLFPHLKPQNSKYSHSVSKWFGKFKTRRGFGPNKVFHSFRHTFTTELSRAGADKMMVSRIAGHAQEGMTESRYIKTSPVDQMKEALDLLDFGIPIDLLKDRWRSMKV